MRHLLRLTLALVLLALPATAHAEQAGSKARSLQAGLVDSGFEHACAVLDDGGAACWGNDAFGQLGDDVPVGAQETAVPVALPAGRTATAIAAGSWHSCAILDDGSASCWGLDNVGQLGDDPSFAGTPTPVPVALPAGRTATAISARSIHTCAILDDGSAWCWGGDLDGSLGDDGTLVDQPLPARVALPAGRTATAISAGANHTCAILDDGSVRCWGEDAAGQLGDDPTLAAQPTPVPVPLPGGRRAAAISAGDGHTCAILEDGAVACWGRDAEGQLGDDATLAGKPTPVLVALPAGRTAIAIAAGNLHSCAILDDGTLACWGHDDAGQLGDEASATTRPTPAAVPLPAGRRATAVVGGDEATCASLDDGSLTCWGRDDTGRLGNGAAGDQAVAATAPAALTVGSLLRAVADVSVTLESAPAGLVVGQVGAATVRVANAGPDAASGLQVLVRSPLVALAQTLLGQGAFDGSTWTVGTLAPGTSTTLGLSLAGLAAGAGSLEAQVTRAPVRDADSRPGNDRAGEDDQAAAAIVVAAAPPPAPPPAPAKLAPNRLTLTLTPDRDETAPHRTRATGRLVVGGLAPRLACAGSVTVTVRVGKAAPRSRTVPLTLTDGACGYASPVALSATQRGSARTATITASFAGNDRLLPAAAKPRKLALT